MSRLLLIAAMVVRLAVPGAVITSWVTGSSASNNSSADASQSNASSADNTAAPLVPLHLSVAQRNALVDDLNSILKLHGQLVGTFSTGGPSDPADATRADTLGSRM